MSTRDEIVERERLEDAFGGLKIGVPWIGHIDFTLGDMRFSDDKDFTAFVTGDGTVHLNTRTMAKFTVPECRGIIVHELLHRVRYHLSRTDMLLSWLDRTDKELARLARTPIPIPGIPFGTPLIYGLNNLVTDAIINRDIATFYAAKYRGLIALPDNLVTWQTLVEAGYITQKMADIAVDSLPYAPEDYVLYLLRKIQDELESSGTKIVSVQLSASSGPGEGEEDGEDGKGAPNSGSDTLDQAIKDIAKHGSNTAMAKIAQGDASDETQEGEEKIDKQIARQKGNSDQVSGSSSEEAAIKDWQDMDRERRLTAYVPFVERASGVASGVAGMTYERGYHDYTWSWIDQRTQEATSGTVMLPGMHSAAMSADVVLDISSSMPADSLRKGAEAIRAIMARLGIPQVEVFFWNSGSLPAGRTIANASTRIAVPMPNGGTTMNHAVNYVIKNKKPQMIYVLTDGMCNNKWENAEPPPGVTVVVVLVLPNGSDQDYLKWGLASVEEYAKCPNVIVCVADDVSIVPLYERRKVTE